MPSAVAVLPSYPFVQDRIESPVSCVNPSTFSNVTLREIGVEKFVKTPIVWWSTRAPPTA